MSANGLNGGWNSGVEFPTAARFSRREYGVRSQESAQRRGFENLLGQVQIAGPGYCLGSIARIEFAVKTIDVRLYCAQGHH